VKIQDSCVTEHRTFNTTPMALLYSRVALMDRDVCIETLTAHFDRQSIVRTGRIRVKLDSPNHCAVVIKKRNTNYRISMPHIPGGVLWNTTYWTTSEQYTVCIKSHSNGLHKSTQDYIKVGAIASTFPHVPDFQRQWYSVILNVPVCNSLSFY
jgi:hypothetical protein